MKGYCTVCNMPIYKEKRASICSSCSEINPLSSKGFKETRGQTLLRRTEKAKIPLCAAIIILPLIKNKISTTALSIGIASLLMLYVLFLIFQGYYILRTYNVFQLRYKYHHINERRLYHVLFHCLQIVMLAVVIWVLYLFFKPY